jgi:methionyl-tRNA formyltransferase
VFSGNVGATDRLAFAALGHAVNLTSRLETLTKRLDRPLLVSDDFARACDRPLVSLGFHPVRGRSETGLSIFRPTPGLDEGPVILQKRVMIGPDDTAGSLYFDKIFPLGVSALVEAADLVVSGRATESTQDESRATYEGWVREAESHINWANHIDFVYDLIRGCNPAPGAWTNYGERKLYLFDARKIAAGTFGAVRGRKIGEVVAIGEQGMRILAQGGFIEVSRVRLDDGPKIGASEAGIAAGTILGS